MRKDFKKILVERERINSSESNWENDKLRRKSVDEESPKYSSMKPKSRAWQDRKELNENLNPLKSFLRTSIGRKWDDIYSEICSQNDSTSAVGKHIFEHLKYMVELNPYFIDKIAYDPCHKSYFSRYPIQNQFYVDLQGILRWAERTKRVEPVLDICVKNIDEFNFLVRSRKGIWFHFTYSDEYAWQEAQLRPEKRDVDGRLIYNAYVIPRQKVQAIKAFPGLDSRDYFLLPQVKKECYLITIRQCGKRELKKYE